MFCGDSCYQRALHLYHRTECGILSFLVSLELGKMELLALRTLLIASDQGKELNNLRTHPVFGYPFAKRRFDANQRYISHDYLSVHNLEDHFARRSIAELFRRSAAAVILLYALKHSSFFNTDVNTKNFSNVRISSLIRRILYVITTIMFTYVALSCVALRYITLHYLTLHHFAFSFYRVFHVWMYITPRPSHNNGMS